MIIEIKGVEFENKGSQLMLVAIVKKLRGWWPDVRIALRVSSKSRPDQLATISALRKISLRKNFIDLNLIAYLIPKFLRAFFVKLGIEKGICLLPDHIQNGLIKF